MGVLWPVKDLGESYVLGGDSRAPYYDTRDYITAPPMNWKLPLNCPMRHREKLVQTPYSHVHPNQSHLNYSSMYHI